MLICIDIDNTFISTGEVFSAQNVESIISCPAHIAFITGRLVVSSQTFAHKLKKELGGFEFFLAPMNGSWIFSSRDLERPIVKNTIPERVAQKFFCEEFDCVPFLFGATNTGYLTRLPKEEVPFESGQKYYANTEPKDTAAHELVSMGIFSADSALKQKAVSFAQNHDLAYAIYDTVIEITPKSKGDAVKWLQGVLGIPREKTIAFGDHHNDLPMFAESGIRIAMSNGEQVLKAKADLIADNSCYNGVAKGIMYAKTLLGQPV